MPLTIAPSLQVSQISPRDSAGPLQTLLKAASNQPRADIPGSQPCTAPTRADSAYRDLGGQALKTLLGTEHSAFINRASDGASRDVITRNAQALREVAINLSEMANQLRALGGAAVEAGCQSLADATKAFRQLAADFHARPAVALTTCSLKNDKPYRAFEALKGRIDSIIASTPGLVDLILHRVTCDYVVDGLRAAVEARGGGQLGAADAQAVMEHGTLSDVARQVLDSQLENALNARTGQGLSEGIRSLLSVLELSRPMTQVAPPDDRGPACVPGGNTPNPQASAGSGPPGMHNVGNGGGAHVTTGSVNITLPEIDYGTLADRLRWAGSKPDVLDPELERLRQRISDLERQANVRDSARRLPVVEAEPSQGFQPEEVSAQKQTVMSAPVSPATVETVARPMAAAEPARLFSRRSESRPVVLSMGSSGSNGERVNQHAVNPWIQFNRVRPS